MCSSSFHHCNKDAGSRERLPYTTHAAEADALLRGAIGAVEGASLVRLVYAEVLWALKREADARQAIDAAREGVLSQASKLEFGSWRERFLRDVPENARILALADSWAAST